MRDARLYDSSPEGALIAIYNVLLIEMSRCSSSDMPVVIARIPEVLLASNIKPHYLDEQDSTKVLIWHETTISEGLLKTVFTT